MTNYEHKIARFDKEEGILLNYEFREALVNKYYQRKVYNIYSLLAEIGGFYTALGTGGTIFTATFSYQLMMSSLIGKLFHFRPKFKAELKKKKGSKKLKKSEKLSCVEEVDYLKKLKKTFSVDFEA